MTLLLDTATLLWFYLDDSKLTASAKAAIVDPDNNSFVSAASYWEIAIKISIGKYALAENLEDFVQHAVIDNGFVVLPIEPRHAAQLSKLPFHHKDPLDRLIVAQAIAESMTVVSPDPYFDAYGVPRIWNR